MLQKWLLTLVAFTLLFIISSFFIDTHLVFAYRWMTLGISIVSFIVYFIVYTSNQKENEKIIGGNITAIVLKFILSMVVVILYIIFWGMRNPVIFAFFFIAYIIFSIINYIGAYNYKKD